MDELQVGDQVEWVWRTDSKGVVTEIVEGNAIVRFTGKEGLFWLQTSTLKKLTDAQPGLPESSA
jgi:hypothetical protein